MLKRDTLQVDNLRTIRSFVPREGRMTAAHREALQRLWPQYGLALQDSCLDFTKIFGRSAEVSLEIGFGDGSNLLNIAQQNPQHDYIGIEVYRTGIAKLLTGIEIRKITNVRVFCADATEVLQHCIPDLFLRQLILLFPDPWPKARHHKRRIVQPEFMALLRRKLVVNGSVHMATDWENYAQHMLEVMENASGWSKVPPGIRSATKFEQRGQRIGYGIWDLMFRKSADKVV